jgi:GNAT superfamily N-acetyltransferase
LTEVRPAGWGDARVLATLRYAFRCEAAATGEPVEPPEEFVERTTAWLADRLQAGSWDAWLAWAASPPELPVGLVLVHLVEKVPNPVTEPEILGYVSSLYVRPPWRGRGIGGRLLGTAVEFCRDRGADTVVLWPTRRSIPLYQRHGFRHQGAVMELHWMESSQELRQVAGPW